MPESSDLWRIEVGAPSDAVAAFENVLGPYCEAISWFVTDSEAAWRIEGFSRTRPDAAALARALADTAAARGIAVPEASIARVAPRDWLAENLRMFPPTEAGRYFICGTHYESAPPAGRVTLTLNPGAAFGSGAHESTAGVLLALDGLARARRFARPLDMGTGSGILALAMAKTWRVPIVAADRDPVALAVARRNAQRNRLAGLIEIVRSDGYRSAALGGPFDLIVANILARPVCRMAADLRRHLSPGGVAVLSGFVEKDRTRVVEAHRRLGLRLVRVIGLGEWRTVVLARGRSAARALRLAGDVTIGPKGGTR